MLKEKDHNINGFNKVGKESDPIVEDQTEADVPMEDIEVDDFS